MIFNTFPFLIFFIILFVFYWILFNKNLKLQNLSLLAASLFFYSYWNWKFSFFLVGVCLFNFFLGILIEKAKNNNTKKLFFYIGMAQGIGGLVYFKYFNFFITSFKDAFSFLHFDFQTLNLIIPLGISFFSFRTISYILDIEKGKITACKDWIVFFNYVTFFPSILSGPIDKASVFIPQIRKLRTFDYALASEGMRQILWGLFKKMVIADNCATVVNPIFESYISLPSSSLLLGAFLYAFQMYADFSGYSDMAIGFSKILGIKINKNFEYPFFAQNVADYWRRWHISLTVWLTEYVFTPLSILFRDYGKWGLIMAITINFVICGLWHGANWTYVLFGLIHGLFFIPLILKGTLNKKNKIAKDKIFPSAVEIKNMVFTFSQVLFAFIIFRSDTISIALGYYKGIFSKSIFSIPSIPGNSIVALIIPFFFIIVMIIIEWFQRDKEFGLYFLNSKSLKYRISIYFIFVFIIIFFGSPNIFSGQKSQFIYLQF